MDWTPCEICGATATERHHVYGAANRKHSEKWGAVVWLCPACHRTGKHAVHRDYKTAVMLKCKYQAIFEAQYGHDAFMKIFARNYL